MVVVVVRNKANNVENITLLLLVLVLMPNKRIVMANTIV